MKVRVAVVVLALVLVAASSPITGRLGWSETAGCSVKGEALHYYIEQPGSAVWLAGVDLPGDGSAAARCARASGTFVAGDGGSCTALITRRLIGCE